MSKKMKKMSKAAKKELKKALAEIIFPMFERADHDIKIYATSKGIVIVPAEDDEEYPEMAEGIALNTVSGFLGLKNKITISEISMDKKDGTLYASNSIAPHLYVKTTEQKKEYVPVDATVASDVEPDSEEEGEDTTPVTDEVEDLDARFEDVDGDTDEREDVKMESCHDMLVELLERNSGQDILDDYIEFSRIVVNANIGIRNFINTFPTDMQKTMRRLRRPDSTFKNIEMPMLKRCFNLLTSACMENSEFEDMFETLRTYVDAHNGIYLLDAEKYPWSKVTGIKLFSNSHKDLKKILKGVRK